MEVVYLEVERGVGEPRPWLMRFLHTNVAIVNGRFELELIIFEIDDSEQCQSLLFIILDEDLFRHCVLGW